MNHIRFCTLLMLLGLSTIVMAENPEAKSAREGLQPFNDLIGTWRCTGTPDQGSREEKQKGFWTEVATWEWQFKGNNSWLKLAIKEGKYHTHGELHYLPETKRYRLRLWTREMQELNFEGSLQGKKLTLERIDPATKDTQRMIFSLLHSNRHLIRYEVRRGTQVVYSPIHSIGATKEGVAFAGPDGKPECIVSGGLGTIAVLYKGKTYYVCCTGCKDAFNDEPERWIKEAEARKNQPEK